MNLSDLTRYRKNADHQVIISLDLGKQQDYTAFTVSEVVSETRMNKRNKMVKDLMVTVKDIQRLPLGTGYDVVADVVHNLVWDERLWLIDDQTHKPILPTLLVDVGGVGDAVADDLRRTLGVGFVRYRLVRGTAETKKAPRNYTVPRTRMFEKLYAAFTGDRIKVPKNLKLARTLLEELKNLKPEMHEETGSVRVVHREGEHDDLAICLAATNWWAKRSRQSLRVVTNEATVAKLMGRR